MRKINKPYCIQELQFLHDLGQKLLKYPDLSQQNIRLEGKFIRPLSLLLNELIQLKLCQSLKNRPDKSESFF